MLINLIIGLTIVVSTLFGVTAYTGGRTSSKVGSSDFPVAMYSHRSWAKWSILVFLFTILVVEIYARTVHHPPLMDTDLFKVHLCFAITSFAMFIAIWFRFSGDKYPGAHSLIAILALTCLAIAAVTGIVILCA
ncbi:MAG: hypothetical protein JWO43_95 [Candidatus Adlerbacteria bacterium]|nr:hypothetical protein [Candidatus Adlerbacteria bacterium]